MEVAKPVDPAGEVAGAKTAQQSDVARRVGVPSSCPQRSPSPGRPPGRRHLYRIKPREEARNGNDSPAQPGRPGPDPVRLAACDPAACAAVHPPGAGPLGTARGGAAPAGARRPPPSPAHGPPVTPNP